MADSDYEFEGDGASDDEYVAPKSTSGSRTQAKASQKARKKANAWERRGSTPIEDDVGFAGVHEGYGAVESADAEDSARVEKSLQEREEDRKRKR